MHHDHAYAHGALLKLAEHDVDPVSFVQAAIQSQDPIALKVALALDEYSKAVHHEKQAELQKEAITYQQLAALGLIGGAGGGLAGGGAGGVVGGPPGAAVGAGLGAPAGAFALPAGAMALQEMDHFLRQVPQPSQAPPSAPNIRGLLPAGRPSGMEVFENIGPQGPSAGGVEALMESFRNRPPIPLENIGPGATDPRLGRSFAGGLSEAAEEIPDLLSNIDLRKLKGLL